MDSPFCNEEVSVSKSRTLQPKFFAAISKEDLVLVLGSQKIFAIVSVSYTHLRAHET